MIRMYGSAYTSWPPAQRAAQSRRRCILGHTGRPGGLRRRRMARPQLGDEPLIRIAQCRDRRAHRLGRPWARAERRRVLLRVGEAQLEHAEQLLRLALDLDPARVGRDAEHEERIVDNLRAHLTPESKPRLRASLSSGNSCQSAFTTRRRSSVSLRSMAALPSLTSFWARGRSRA